MSVVESIVVHEGFESKPYPDPLSGGEPWTFGHGLTFITEQESRMIVERRVKELERRLQTKRMVFNSLPHPVRDVLIEMAYQIGVDGLMMFRNMWTALERWDFDLAADEMLDSKWHAQTPKRAESLAKIVRAQL